MLAVAKQSEKARAAAQQRQRVVGGATSAAASSGPTGAQRWRQASSVVDIVSEQPEDLEVAMLDKRIADLRRELDQLSEDQTATVTFVSAEIDRSLQHVAYVPAPSPPTHTEPAIGGASLTPAARSDHLDHDLIASDAGPGSSGGARVCTLS